MPDRWSLTLARDLLIEQEGVIARWQLLELGARDHDVERMLRRRELAVLHPGIHLDHTGRPTLAQREWAAVLACWPAALSHRSALPSEIGPTTGGTWRPIDVAVDVTRRPGGPAGVRVHRVVGLDARTAWNRSPPRVRVEHAAIDVAAGLLRDDRVDQAFDLLARTCHTRLTTPGRIADVLAGRSRVPQRRLLADLLTDLAEGSCSVLERAFVHDVERPHGLPAARRQQRRLVDGRSTYVDADYGPYGVVVELDGLAFHDGPRQRHLDAVRDLAHLAEGGTVTARLTHAMVFRTPCDTAVQLARLLQRGGWRGALQPCRRCHRAA